MRDDQMVRRIDGRLHVVADHTRAAPAGCHRAGIGIGEGDLLIRRSEHLSLNRLEAVHLFFELGELLLEPRGPGRKLLRRRRTGGCLPIGGVELAQIARNALLDLRQAPLHLPFREIIVARVHRLELAAVDRNARLRQQPHLPAQSDELRADLLDGRAVALAEISDGFVIRSEASCQPHHFQIAAGLTLQPPARLHAVEVAVNVELEQRRGMIGGPARRQRLHTVKPQIGQIERLDEYIDRANRIALFNPVAKAFRQQRRLPAIRPLNKAPHMIPPQIAQESYRENQIPQRVFTQSGSEPEAALFGLMSAFASCGHSVA